jgi:hypothetical protein
MKNEISVFWPRNRIHTVSSFALDTSDAAMTPEMARHITTILKLTQAARGLQPIVDAATQTVSEGISFEIAKELDCLATFLNDADSARGLRLRARILRGGDKRQLATEIASLNEQQLVGFCGDLTTWLGKSRRTYFSSFFAVPDVRYQKVADAAHKLLPDAFAELRDTLDERLILGSVSEFRLTHLIAAAGEANLYPKHFAYFLPEDEGIKYATGKRTIVFANTYTALFNLISQEESRAHICVTDGVLRTSEEGRHLLSWFKGHDIGHSIARPETDYGIISKSDRWASMVLQEALADVFGFLLCIGETWRDGLGLEPAMVCQVYCFEMLRYLRRAPKDFPDAGAAFVQLHFLIEQGYAKFGTGDGKIAISSADMIAGMIALAKQLSRSVLTGNLATVMDFANRYCPHLNRSAHDRLTSLLGRSVHTLDYVQPIYQYQDFPAA